MRSTASCPFALVRAVRITSAPARASSNAVFQPMPLFAPVTTASLPAGRGCPLLATLPLMFSFLVFKYMSAYILILIRKKSAFSRDPRPQHLESGDLVHSGSVRVLAREFNCRLRQRTHGRPDKSLRQILHQTLRDSVLRHCLNLDKGGGTSRLRGVRQPLPDHRLPQNLVLFLVGDTPFHVSIPHMLQSMPYARLAREAGHHRVRQLQ